jgi:membrane fusion protein, copper/silver efflux system
MTRPQIWVSAMLLALPGWGCQRGSDSPETEDHGAHSAPERAATSPGSGGAASDGAEHAAHGASAAAAATSAGQPSPAANGAAGDHVQMGAGEMAPGAAAEGTKGAALPAGYAVITLEPERARAIGLRVAPVEEREFSKVVRTTGVVVLDETRTSHVHAKVRGWIESISVDFVGKHVTAGTPLCTIYSQEVLAAELEFLSILDQSSSAAPLSGALAGAEKQARQQLLSAARRRLALWDVPASEIARLETTREPRRTFTLDAPRSGIVAAKQALAGMFIDPSVELYVISDVRNLWVLADLYESDVPGVKIGDAATLSIQGLPGVQVPAQVAFLPPTVEEATRTLKVRFNLDNTNGAVRPGAFATVEMNVELGRSLAAPETAVIHAGRQAIVFVAQGDRLEPRSVTLGPLVEGYYGVEAGLARGEAVAVGAQFLIDSESRLRATSGKGPGHGGH